MKNKTNNKALIVSPYLDHLGGGERYMLTVASILQEEGWDLAIAWDDADHVVRIASKMGISLAKPTIDKRVKDLYFARNSRAMRQATTPYDLVVYLSDGSIPRLGAKKNILHMQVPFHGVNGRSITNRFKLRLINDIIVNSKFTKAVIDREFSIDSTVIYPPVDLIGNDSPKENLILSVGRFESSINIKRHDILIRAFQGLEKEVDGWRLVLVGAVKEGSDTWVNELRNLAGESRIELVTNVSHQELRNYYKKSSIYWLAGGYEVDERVNPELTEHFGISAVEAISAGSIPLVVPKGGQIEIISNSIFHWNTVEELIDLTKLVIKTPEKYMEELAKISIKEYDISSFRKSLLSLLS